MLRMNFPNRREQRRKDAEARNEAYAKLSKKEKVARNSKRVITKLKEAKPENS